MILCCGEALIDMLPRETTQGESAYAPYPGGSVFNTAIAAGRLGAPVGFFSGISNDLFGQMLATSLEDAGVDTGFAVRSDLLTTLAMVTLVNGQATYLFLDENTAGRMLSEDQLPDLGPEVDALFFGSISLVGEPCGAVYEALMRREAPHRVTMIDPNIRPGFVTDEQGYRARLEAMVGMADIVKISDEDMAWLYGPGSLEHHVAHVLAQGPKIVCLTQGSEGASAYTTSGKTTVPAQRVDVVDTIGAGDTFSAGFAVGLHEAGVLTKTALETVSAEDLASALNLGVRAAAVTVSRAGANPPRRDEL